MKTETEKPNFLTKPSRRNPFSKMMRVDRAFSQKIERNRVKYSRKMKYKEW